MTQQTSNRIEESPSPFRTPCFTPTFMRSSTPLKNNESSAKSLTFKPPSRPSSTISTISTSTISQTNNKNQGSTGQNLLVPDVTLESDDDVQFISEFHPQKISTQSQRRFLPYKPVRSTGTLVKTETEPQTVAEIIRSQALSQRTQISPSIKNEPDVQFSFEFQPQKMATQIQKVFLKKFEIFLNLYFSPVKKWLRQHSGHHRGRHAN